MKFQVPAIAALICAFILSSAVPVRAQPAGEKRWSISAQLNANLTQIPKYREIYYSNPIVGGGLLYKYRGMTRFDLMGGLFVNGVGYTRNAADTFEVFMQRHTEWYLDIPVGMLYYPGRMERTWGFYAGLTPSFLLRKHLSKPEDVKQYNLKPDHSKVGRLDLTVQVGGMIKLTPRWYLSAHYSHSLTNHQNIAYNSGRFSAVQVGIGFQLTKPHYTESIKTSANRTVSKYDKDEMVMLVRLKTEHKQITALENAGMKEEAAELRETVQFENESTIDAFKRSFDYCPVYFFYDTSSRDLVDEKYAGHLFDADGNYIDTAVKPGFDVLIAEFGSPYSAAFGTSSGFGLVIYDYQFNQLEEPFPYYTQNMFGLISRSDVVAKFSKRLLSYQGEN